jgi:hypothetical protein
MSITVFKHRSLLLSTCRNWFLLPLILQPFFHNPDPFLATIVRHQQTLQSLDSPR